MKIILTNRVYLNIFLQFKSLCIYPILELRNNIHLNKSSSLLTSDFKIASICFCLCSLSFLIYFLVVLLLVSELINSDFNKGIIFFSIKSSKLVKFCLFLVKPTLSFKINDLFL